MRVSNKNAREQVNKKVDFNGSNTYGRNHSMKKKKICCLFLWIPLSNLRLQAGQVVRKF